MRIPNFLRLGHPPLLRTTLRCCPMSKHPCRPTRPPHHLRCRVPPLEIQHPKPLPRASLGWLPAECLTHELLESQRRSRIHGLRDLDSTSALILPRTLGQRQAFARRRRRLQHPRRRETERRRKWTPPGDPAQLPKPPWPIRVHPQRGGAAEDLLLEEQLPMQIWRRLATPHVHRCRLPRGQHPAHHEQLIEDPLPPHGVELPLRHLGLASGDVLLEPPHHPYAAERTLRPCMPRPSNPPAPASRCCCVASNSLARCALIPSASHHPAECQQAMLQVHPGQYFWCYPRLLRLHSVQGAALPALPWLLVLHLQPGYQRLTARLLVQVVEDPPRHPHLAQWARVRRLQELIALPSSHCQPRLRETLSAPLVRCSGAPRFPVQGFPRATLPLKLPWPRAWLPHQLLGLPQVLLPRPPTPLLGQLPSPLEVQLAGPILSLGEPRDHASPPECELQHCAGDVQPAFASAPSST
mmetsp:Transcript_23400/g.54433  ORF Transcript_23400/g.54433 Transcript_23400/m.54433 type:complete len:468 (-) Transcript_23400:856-2259(-)